MPPVRDLAEVEAQHSQLPNEDEAAVPTPHRSRVRHSALIGLSVGVLVVLAGAAAVRHVRAASDQAVGLFVVVPKKTDEVPASKACKRLWDQCGGKNYEGPTCCEDGLTCEDHPLEHMPDFRQCRLGAFETPTKKELAKEKCGAKWDQCGGTGFDGPTCCEDGLICQNKPLKTLSDFQQCRPITVTTTTTTPPACEDMEGKWGTKCHHKVHWDMTVGIWQNPQLYHGLTPQSGWKEFQEQDWMLNEEQSQCPPPCGPGTCYQVLRYEGCDQYNEWTCNKDDGTLGFHCCCNAYPTNISQALVKNALRQKEERREREAEKENNETRPSLFCVALMIPHSYEVDLLRAQLKGNFGMFGCDEWAVFSNESISLAPDEDHGNSSKYMTQVMNMSLEVKRGGAFNTALNTPIFIHFWHKVLQDERALKFDLIVKLDPDTMFMPSRLQALMLSKTGPLADPEPKAGMYLNNCFLGMHGPIEVLSSRALRTYSEWEKNCTEGPAAKHGQEDWYLRACFEDLGILKVDAYNLLLEGDWACKERPSSWKPDYRPPCHAPQVAFHPFKDIDSYMHCWAQAVMHPIPHPLPLISDIPVPEMSVMVDTPLYQALVAGGGAAYLKGSRAAYVSRWRQRLGRLELVGAPDVAANADAAGHRMQIAHFHLKPGLGCAAEGGFSVAECMVECTALFMGERTMK
eukprot:CAMPEP_0115262294 /NCGR_PEP_ID=MMETSP0270-20121206/49307_1 /TAXON_ID=71861 /ORGANISM="Scrippsiella trochoidea, Strain CCMP3099" /LENGTH=686 /DNA_ID=CAMNT_0002678213 /DNA_START=168 /DNA_END=2228 /DNA_ORIENTATION=-